MVDLLGSGGPAAKGGKGAKAKPKPKVKAKEKVAS
jgi:hypothetical protein